VNHCIHITIPIEIHIPRGEHMSKVLLTINFNILPAPPPPPPPLAVSPDTATAPDETVGVDVGTVELATVSGGKPPYAVAVDASSTAPLPPGLSLGLDDQGNVQVTGVPEAEGAGAVVVAITDSAS
jgi:hypothetical protein